MNGDPIDRGPRGMTREGRQLHPESPNRARVAGITSIPTGAGWLYPAAVEDLDSRRVVGWSMADHPEIC